MRHVTHVLVKSHMFGEHPCRNPGVTVVKSKTCAQEHFVDMIVILQNLRARQPGFGRKRGYSTGI